MFKPTPGLLLGRQQSWTVRPLTPTQPYDSFGRSKLYSTSKKLGMVTVSFMKGKNNRYTICGQFHTSFELRLITLLERLETLWLATLSSPMRSWRSFAISSPASTDWYYREETTSPQLPLNVSFSDNYCRSPCAYWRAGLQVTEKFLNRLAEGIRPQTRSYVTQFVSIQEDGVSIVEKSIEMDLLSPLENDRKSDPIENPTYTTSQQLRVSGKVNLALRPK